MEAVLVESIKMSLESLLTLSKEHISLVRNFRKDLEMLKESFGMVGDVLQDAETRQVSDLAVKRWLRSLQDLAFEADNVFDEISYRSLQPKKNIKEKVQSFFLICNSNNDPISYRLNLGSRIKDIDEKLKLINQQANDFGLQHINRELTALCSGSMETDSYSLDPNIIGRESNVSTIVEMLITTGPPERRLSILPIAGMGGLGKTTLAKLVFRDQQIISHFGDTNRVWVHVPREFDVVVLLKKIITSMNLTANVADNREALLKMLQSNLGAKRYLLVLDDVWNEEMRLWDDFVYSLSGITSVTGNCMIVTTRSKEVASIVKSLPVHEIESLSKDDCWSIIKGKAFGSGDIIQPEFETVGNNIAKRCHGLPLAANVLGGLLRNKSIDKWLSTENSWLPDLKDGDSINKILKLSYDNLSLPSLKKCFAYCSIFPKGHEIIEEQLIELWMAEGFLQTDKKSNNMETTGGKFFNLLLQNSLLQVAARDMYGDVIHCCMHDLVHDLACSILEGESNNDDICQSRYVGYNSNGCVRSSSISKEHTRYLRAFFFNGKVGDIVFSGFKSLHSLTLMGDDVLDLPTSIGNLIHLRYLDISKTRITRLPHSVGELYHLQTLRAKTKYGRSFLDKLPDSLKYCISLRHLHIEYDTVLPPKIGRLSSLQTLRRFNVRKKKGFGISELGSLNNLRGRLEIHNLENVFDKREARSADLFRKSDIYEIMFQWDKSDRDGEENDESTLESLQSPPNIKSLGIWGFKGKRLPSWTSKMAVQDHDLDGCWKGLNNLIEIRLVECSEVEELPMIGHLPHLKSLEIRNLRNVRSIGSSFYNIDNCRRSSSISSNGVFNTIAVVFPALERLELHGMPNLREWAQVEIIAEAAVVVFPRLEYLKLEGCSQLMSAPSRFLCLKELYISDMDSGVPLENILSLCGGSNNNEYDLRSLTHLEVSGIKGLEYLPDGVFANNHNLKRLRISECLNLRELPDGLHTLNSLEYLTIVDCPNLKSIAAAKSLHSTNNIKKEGCFFGTSLRRLMIMNCQELIHLPIEMVESCAPSLEELILDGLNSLTNIRMVIGCLRKMPRLTYLRITEVPKFSTNEIETGSLNSCSSSLQRLKMSPSSTNDNVSFNEAVDAVLQTSKSSLTDLSLTGMSHWYPSCLPVQIQHLSCLFELRLYDFGMEALPEWFGNLSSLEWLYLLNCTKLRHLPSKEAMQGLTKLTSLFIME